MVSSLRVAARALRAILLEDGHLGDWLVAFILTAQAFVFPVYFIQPLDRYRPKKDPATSYPHVPVPLTEAQKWLLLLLTPPLAALLCNLPRLHRAKTAAAAAATTSRPDEERSRHERSVAAAVLDVHHCWLSAFSSFCLESCFKKYMNLVGRHRPDYQWRADHGTDVREGLFSYPSGHAAEMFAVGTVVSLYFVGKARVLDPTSPPRRWGGQLALAALCLLPLGGATLVALSRAAGYRHDFSDINAGMALGLCCGAFAYLLNFEAPAGARAGLARARGAVGVGEEEEERRGKGRPLLLLEEEGGSEEGAGDQAGR